MTRSRRKATARVKQTAQTETITWCGVTIEVAYEADWLNSSSGPHPVSHLAITSVVPAKAPLPITDTGYLSYFTEPGVVEQQGGPSAFVLVWLDDAAQSKEWRRLEVTGRQLDLFR